MTFTEAIQKAKENKLPYKYQESMVDSDFFTESKYKDEFIADFIFTVEALS